MAQVSYRQSIFVSQDVTGVHWQLGPLPPGHGAFVMIGWNVRAEDGEVPTAVVKTISRALAGYGRLTFPSSAGAGNRWGIKLLSTEREEDLHQIFGDPNYAWWLQSQFALISRPDTQSPNPEKLAKLSGNLMEASWAETLPELIDLGIDAVLRPGVDGDVAGLLCASSSILAQFKDRLRLAAAAFECDFQELPPGEFEDAISS